MFNLTTIIGARPQFIKCAVLSRLIADDPDVTECLIHTGQHHDTKMSEVFFKDLRIPTPVHNLAISGGNHGAMTAKMLGGIEALLLENRPDAVLVYGDTNSTLAGALAATKLHIPVVHVEAGLRSFNRKMPEEVNRVLTDHVSQRLYCSTGTSIQNLTNEGITDGVLWVGDIMFDAALHAMKNLRALDSFLPAASDDRPLAFCTLHRAENTDDPAILASLFEFITQQSKEYRTIFPVHPRTRKKAEEFGLALPDVTLLEPLGYMETHSILAKSKLVLTDSGGLQKEAYFHRVPCITLRNETEWVETIINGWNRIWTQDHWTLKRDISDYGTGDTGKRILDDIKSTLRP